jgi:hypothetical protein
MCGRLLIFWAFCKINLGLKNFFEKKYYINYQQQYVKFIDIFVEIFIFN